MGLIQFTKNYDDLSTDKGYQFKFYCDKCGNGYLSSFQTSVLGAGSALLKGLGNWFSGAADVGDSAHQIQRAVGGPQHDAALKKAVEEAKPHFTQCSRCGKWVCPEQCWNAKRGLCEECAPDLEEEMAAAQASAQKDQVWEKMAKVDHTADLDMKGTAVARCPKCNAKTQGAKFCPECGVKLASKVTCAKCGTKADEGTKFCPECGQKLAT